MNTCQIKAWFPAIGRTKLLASPSLSQTPDILNGGSGDLHGNQSFCLGGAILAHFSGRMRGRVSSDGATIETELAGRRVALPANWEGRNPGAERHAIHGLIVNRKMDRVVAEDGVACHRVEGVLQADDFVVGWPSRTELHVVVTLAESSFQPEVTATNVGEEVCPTGIGWQPYFAFPSGRREQVRLRIPAAQRVAVNNPDDVFPTGELLPVVGTACDLSVPGGTALRDVFLTECYTGLTKTPEGHALAEVMDPAAGYGVRIIGLSPEIQAFLIYAPPETPSVALEPWFNLPDPFSPAWGGISLP